MNIDYAKIIETANARKETLQQLTELLKQASDMLEVAKELYGWMDLVHLTMNQLDREGTALLPKAVYDQLQSFPIRRMQSVLNDMSLNVQDRRGLEPLAAVLRSGQP